MKAGQKTGFNPVHAASCAFQSIRKKDLVCGAVLVLAVFLCYFNSLGNGFVWDDHEIIERNPLFSSFSNIPRVLTSEDGQNTGYYRPVTYLSFLLDRQIFGVNPLPYHLVNILLHASVAVLLFRLAFLLIGDRLAALTAALVFSLHPVAGETVNFLSGGRNTLLCAIFLLAAFIAYVKTRHLAALLLYALAVFSKEFGVILPLLLFVYDRFYAEQRPGPARYAPYVLVILVFLGVRQAVLHGYGFKFDLPHLPARLLFIPGLLFEYFKNLCLPLWLKPYYVLLMLRRAGLSAMLACLPYLAGLAAIFAGAVFLYRRGEKVYLFSVIWMLVFFAPVIQIIPFGIQMADRYAYFSLMGFALPIGAVIKKAGKMRTLPVFAALLAFYAVIVIVRNPIWKDDMSLYSEMSKSGPGGIGYYYYANELRKKGMFDQAINLYRQTIATQPGYMDAYVNLGGTLMLKGDNAGAVKVFQDALSIDSGTSDSLVLQYALAEAYRATGNVQAAIDEYKTVLRQQPSASICRELADLLCHAGDRMEADALYRRALSMTQTPDTTTGRVVNPRLETPLASGAAAGQRTCGKNL